jgi:hypothetical protein
MCCDEFQCEKNANITIVMYDSNAQGWSVNSTCGTILLPGRSCWIQIATAAAYSDVLHRLISESLEPNAACCTASHGVACCGIGLLGGRCPGPAGYVTVTGPTDGATAAGGR